MPDYKHGETGVLVSIADGKSLGPEWVPVDEAEPPKRSTRAKKSGEE